MMLGEGLEKEPRINCEKKERLWIRDKEKKTQAETQWKENRKDEKVVVVGSVWKVHSKKINLDKRKKKQQQEQKKGM